MTSTAAAVLDLGPAPLALAVNRLRRAIWQHAGPPGTGRAAKAGCRAPPNAVPRRCGRGGGVIRPRLSGAPPNVVSVKSQQRAEHVLDVVLIIQREGCAITWSVSHLGYSTYYGQFTGLTGTLTLDNGTTNLNGRLGTTATTGTLTVAGEFKVIGNAGAPTTEAVGTLNIASSDVIGSGQAINITHGDIAALLGFRREVITLALGKLEEAGAIQRGRGVIEVVQREALENISCDCYWLISGKPRTSFTQPAGSSGCVFSRAAKPSTMPRIIAPRSVSLMSFAAAIASSDSTGALEPPTRASAA